MMTPFKKRVGFEFPSTLLNMMRQPYSIIV